MFLAKACVCPGLNKLLYADESINRIINTVNTQYKIRVVFIIYRLND